MLVERDAGLFGDRAKIFNDRHDERNAIFAAFALGFAFGIAGDERAVRARRGFCGAEDADVVVDLAFERVGVDETVDAHGSEEMADAFANAAFWNLLAQREGRSKWAPVRAAEHTTQYIHHHGQAVAFVSAAFAIRTQGKKTASVDGVVGICGVAAVIVDAPAEGDFFAFAARHFNFSVSRSACGHVDHDGWLFFAGESDGDGIGAEHALHAPERSDEAGGVGHGPADEIAFESLENVVAGDAEMVGVADADPAGAGFRGHVHGDAIRMGTYDETKAVVAVDGGGAHGGADCGDFGLWVNVAFTEHADVAIEACYAVGIEIGRAHV